MLISEALKIPLASLMFMFPFGYFQWPTVVHKFAQIQAGPVGYCGCHDGGLMRTSKFETSNSSETLAEHNNFHGRAIKKALNGSSKALRFLKILRIDFLFVDIRCLFGNLYSLCSVTDHH